MDKLYETNVKFNKESSSLLIEKSKEENELLNNNNKNGVCCKDITNGCHSNNSQIENNVENNTETIENENPEFPKSSSELEYLNENLSEDLFIRSQSDKSNIESSSNSSTDNLSYLSDNCIVEEIILSDEELSRNSDDCIYAYRGGAADFDDLSERNHYARIANGNSIGVNVGTHNNDINNQLDDETDFLEMDFEPDPSSELEQSIETNNTNIDDHFRCKFNVDIKSSINDIKSNITSESNIKTDSLDKNKVKQINEQKLDEIHKNDYNMISNSEDKNNDHNKYSELISRTTGAKRKKVLEKNQSPKSSSSSLSLSFSSSCVMNNKANTSSRSNNIKHDKIKTYPNSELRTTNEYVIENNHDDTCLDCLEKEFLSKTIGRNIDSSLKCTKCTSLKRIPNKYKEYNHTDQFPSGHLNTNNEIQLYPSMITRTLGQSTGELLQDRILENSCCETKDSRKNVKFLSVNVDEKTLVQALDKLDVTYNKDIIMEYFNSSCDVQKISDVPEYIVHMSKKNCDYKRIIRLIRMACKEKLHIEFIPSAKLTLEIVKINKFDIIQRWNRKSDLGKLKKLDKRFTEMNVLGKIINLLRQAQQRNTKPLGETIEIPQYYKTGYICIKKV